MIKIAILGSENSHAWHFASVLAPIDGNKKYPDIELIGVYGEPGRIAAYQDGSIWRMVVVVFCLELEKEPEIVISSESRDMRFFSKEELKNIEIVVTHSDIVEDWFVKK